MSEDSENRPRREEGFSTFDQNDQDRRQSAASVRVNLIDLQEDQPLLSGILEALQLDAETGELGLKIEVCRLPKGRQLAGRLSHEESIETARREGQMYREPEISEAACWSPGVGSLSPCDVPRPSFVNLLTKDKR